jgi:hypothetical protein
MLKEFLPICPIKYLPVLRFLWQRVASSIAAVRGSGQFYTGSGLKNDQTAIVLDSASKGQGEQGFATARAPRMTRTGLKTFRAMVRHRRLRTEVITQLKKWTQKDDVEWEEKR